MIGFAELVSPQELGVLLRDRSAGMISDFSLDANHELYYATTSILSCSLLNAYWFSDRSEVILDLPNREKAVFPTRLDDWAGWPPGLQMSI